MTPDRTPSPQTPDHPPPTRGYLLDAVAVAVMCCGATGLLWWVL